MNIFLLTSCDTRHYHELDAENVLNSGWPYPTLQHAQESQAREWERSPQRTELMENLRLKVGVGKAEPVSWERHTDGVWWARNELLGSIANIREFEWSGDALHPPGERASSDAGWFQVEEWDYVDC